MNNLFQRYTVDLSKIPSAWLYSSEKTECENHSVSKLISI